MKDHSVEDMLAVRRQRGLAVRDLTDAPAQRADEPSVAVPSPGGWLRRLLLQFAIVIAVGLALLVMPSLYSCREWATGMLTSNSYARCVGQSTAVTIASLDQQVQTLAFGFRR
ncbi:hypothetical protein [Methylobacterium iners]|uniref:hypothetical protein n=1 Tax=Methylobacterium iners TaxID=418707 RepID=UPI001EE22FBB|nr:hypothetical protein [Methylobacterium iners]